MIGTIIRTLRPQRLPFRRFAQRSAVAIITREGTQGVELLFIQRAIRPGDPWSGDMAFPGGKYQSNDHSMQQTAIRETQEELSIDLTLHSDFVGRHADIVTRQHNTVAPMVVTPYHFHLNRPVSTVPNDEVADTLWVPVHYFQNPQHMASFRWTPFASHSNPGFARHLTVSLPCYQIEDRRIWGLTYLMLRNFIAHRRFRTQV